MFEKPEKGVNFSSKITLTYCAEKKNLHCCVESDEFSEEAQKYCKNNIYSYSNDIDLKKEYLIRALMKKLRTLIICLWNWEILLRNYILE